MKKLKAIGIAIILIILSLLIGKVVFAGTCTIKTGCQYNTDQLVSRELDSNGKVTLTAHDITYHTDNVFCIQYGNDMINDTYYVTATAEINGDYVKLYQYYKDGTVATQYPPKTEDSEFSYGVYGSQNNIMGALLSTVNLSTGYATWTHSGDEKSIDVQGARSEVQIGVWAMWKEWCDTLAGITGNTNWPGIFGNFYSMDGALKYGGTSGVNTITNYVTCLANAHEYSVKVHVLKGSSYDNAQQFILVERQMPVIKLNIEKVWDDNNNSAGVRPSSITLRISGTIPSEERNADLGEMTAAIVDANGNIIQKIKPNENYYEITMEPDANGRWEMTIDLPAKENLDSPLIYYQIEEINLEAGYTSNINIVEYSYETPEKEGSDTELDYAQTETKTRQLGDEPFNDNAQATITNTLETIDIPVIKVWKDDEDAYKLRPTVIEVELYADGEATGKTLKLDNSTLTTFTDSNGDEWPAWKGTFTNLPKYKSGKEITYTVKETSTPAGYKAEVTWDSTGNQIIVTNTLDKINMPVKKVWLDNDNKYEMRPLSITVELWEGGDPIRKLELSADNDWSGVFENLDTNGGEIYYQVTEKVPDGYRTVEKDQETNTNFKGTGVVTINGNNITTTFYNKLTKTGVPVKKVWNENGDEYGNRPDSITVKLLKDGQDTGKTLELNEENEWSGIFNYLDTGYTYTVEEVNPIGYTSKITGNQTNGYTITNTPEKTTISVEKLWEDDDNRDGKRPTSIQVQLLKNGVVYDTKTLSETTGWNASWTNLPKYQNKQLINYTVNEVPIDQELGYEEPVITKVGSQAFLITNTHDPETIRVQVTKDWQDENNLDEYRKTVKVTLYATNKDGVTTKVTKDATGKTITNPIELTDKNNWTYTFENLYRYEDEEEIFYTVEETAIEHYNEETGEPAYIMGDLVEATETEDALFPWTITNTHTPKYTGYIEINGKVWIDGAVGKGNDINGTLDGDKSVEYAYSGVKVTLRNADGTIFDDTSFAETDEKGEYTIKVNYDTTSDVYKLHKNPDGTTEYKSLEERLATAYVEFEYNGIKYTTVANVNSDESYKKSSSNKSKAIENEELRNTFDGNYSTVTSSTDISKAENDIMKATTQNVISFESYLNENDADLTEDKRTVTLKYCNGNGKYIRTNPDGAWNDSLDGTISGLACSGTHTSECTENEHKIAEREVDVIVINNVNLGVFEKEQPDVALFSELSKVEVTMQGQKYTYLYNVRSEANKEVGLKAKFQNKDTYTYRRPVNPADIAYINEPANVDKNLLDVYVTYEIEVGNLSTTLPITVNSIVNSYDAEYTIDSIVKGKQENPLSVSYTASNEPLGENELNFKQATLNDLNITVQPGKDAEDTEVILIRYKVSSEAIKGLLTEEPTLNNAVEIESYSTIYGENTLYAEQRTGGRTGKDYAGYDYNSHPGNAGIKLIEDTDGVTRLKSTENLVEYTLDDGSTGLRPEDDTDIAPSFVLCKDVSKLLSGYVWEDTDIDNGSGPQNLRVGDGKKSDTEQNVENVKVELYKVNDNGTITLANLYKIDETTGEISTKPAVAYSSNTENNRGYYSFGDENYSVVTDVYMMKFIYGDGIEENITSKLGDTLINARDYKSTIISQDTSLTGMFNETVLDIKADTNVYDIFKEAKANNEWHLKLKTLEDDYSIAVDNLTLRKDMSDVQYSNFGDTFNMDAYSAPFAMQIEYNPTSKESLVSEDGNTEFDNELSVFNFGIIERAREDLFVETKIDYLKITLANGQVLTEGNPNNGEMNYVKAIGFGQDIQNGNQARSALEKQLIMEMDTELIQGAQLEVRYAIEATNYSELDYDYYIEAEDKYRTCYYYYGNKDDDMYLTKGSVNLVVDYLDSDLKYEWQTTGWEKVTVEQLLGLEEIPGLDVKGQLISQATAESIKKNGYVAYFTDKFKDLAPGDTSDKDYITATKLLANQDENIYDNHAEILIVDAETARTHKLYKPGNYVPSLATRTLSDNVNDEIPGLHQQDDDRVKITITPPTGLTEIILIYIVPVLIGLIVIGIGVVFIKKKVLTK